MASSYSHRKRWRLSNEVDRISSLPDSLLRRILSFLKTKESVKTCILSKKWKFLWTNVPHLDFSRDGNKESFEKFVTMALLLHKSQSLNKFRLVYEDAGADPFNITAWLSTAISRDVQALDISVSCNEMNNFIALPSSLFTCRSLESLKLHGNLVVRVPIFVSLPRLEYLMLEEVQYEHDESVQKLIHGCPVLKSLHIQRFDKVVMFKISSPTLRHLKIEACRSSVERNDVLKLEINAPLLEYLHLEDHVSKYCTFQSLTSLLELHLYKDVQSPYNADPAYCYCWICNLVQALNCLKVLTLGNIFTIENFLEATSYVSEKFWSLTKLTVNTPWWGWGDLLRILTRSVHLEVFELQDVEHYLAFDESWENQVPECLSSILRRISILGFCGTEGTLGMIKYFLKHGRLLKRVEIYQFYPPVDVSTDYGILKKISTFRRKSSECEVHVIDE